MDYIAAFVSACRSSSFLYKCAVPDAAACFFGISLPVFGTGIKKTARRAVFARNHVYLLEKLT